MLISDYYARYLEGASPTDRRWCGNGGLICLAFLGLLLGVVITIIASLLIGATLILAIVVGIVLALAGAIGGVVVCEAVLAKRILRRVCGVDDPRFLR